MRIKIRVKYRGKWYYAKHLSIDREGYVSFEYLHGLEGVVDSEHIETYYLEEIKE